MIHQRIEETNKKKLYDQDGKELIDITSSFNPQKMEFIKAGSSYSIVFGKKLQSFASNVLGITKNNISRENVNLPFHVLDVMCTLDSYQNKL